MLLFAVVPASAILSRVMLFKSIEKKIPVIAGMLFNLLLIATTLVFVFLGVERLGISNSSASALITIGAGAF